MRRGRNQSSTLLTFIGSDVHEIGVTSVDAHSERSSVPLLSVEQLDDPFVTSGIRVAQECDARATCRILHRALEPHDGWQVVLMTEVLQVKLQERAQVGVTVVAPLVVDEATDQRPVLDVGHKDVACAVDHGCSCYRVCVCNCVCVFL